MSEKTREVENFQDTMYILYTQSLHGKTIYEFISTFNEYEDRLRWQVGAPLWFSPTLPLKTLTFVTGNQREYLPNQMTT